ncbi:MAG: hypothetical protein A2176_06730 [Spirochaetes bacterium RBG_13_51_14]|nr:MAG: hypothetical protein A2176_06730 [Spirochaetes bacterium RBG_13_51_14]
MYDFDNKRVYITGGSSGIGLETARQLALMGAHLILFSRDKVKLEYARKAVVQHRKHDLQKIQCIQLDVRDNAWVEQVMQQAVKNFGAPDVLITNAGVGCADYFENISFETFDAIMATNVYGTRNVIAALFSSMKQKGGRIVIIASIAGHMGMFGYTAYGTSKFALVGFSECLRSELKRYGIRVSVVCPPETDTPLIYEEGKTIPPEARAVKNLAGLLKPEYVAKRIIRGMQRNTYLIIPGFRATLLYFLQCYLPGWIIQLSADLAVKRAEKNSDRE